MTLKISCIRYVIIYHMYKLEKFIQAGRRLNSNQPEWKDLARHVGHRVERPQKSHALVGGLNQH